MANNELSACLETPERVSNLSRAGLGALFLKSQTLSAAVLARLLCDDDRAGSHDASAGGDRLLTVEKTAAMLGVTKGWVYRRGKQLGLAVKLGDGTLRFSNAAIQNFMRANRSARVK